MQVVSLKSASLKLAVTMWMIWTNKNHVVHNHWCCSLAALVTRSVAWVAGWWKAQDGLVASRNVLSTHAAGWCAPLQDFMKINVDAVL